MKPDRIAALCTLAFLAAAASAQTPGTPTEPPAAKQDCAKRHDHGADRLAPTSRWRCKPADKVVKAEPDVARDGAIRDHDHGRVHKHP
jgi:hypothetical protein